MPTQEERRRRLQGDTAPSITIAGVQYGPEEIPEAFGIWYPQQSGIGNIEPTPIPRSSPSPTAFPSPPVTGGGSETLTASAGANNLGIGAGLQGSYPFGEPIVQTPTSDAPTLNLDNAPSLFPGATSGVNPFDQWWRQGEPAFTQGEAVASSSAGTGGSIWAEAPPAVSERGLPDFGEGLSLGQDFNASLGSLEFGEGYPAEPSTVPQDERSFNQPPAPSEFIEDIEWTTTPGDRRFLNTPGAGEDTPATEGGDPNEAGGINYGGTSMSGFGGDLSLGTTQFWNTPLSDMRYGEGYPNTVQAAHEIRVGATSPNSSTGRMERWNGQNWEDEGPIQNDGTGTTYIPLGDPNVIESGNDGTGTTTINRDQPTFQTPPGMTIIGHDRQNGQPIYRDAQGNLFVNEGTGTRVYGTERMLGNYSYLGQPLHQPETARNSTIEGRQAANAAQMSSAAANPTMNLKFITPQSDRGRTTYNTSGRRNIDRPTNITLEGDVIVRHPGGRTLGRGLAGMSAAYAGGLG